MTLNNLMTTQIAMKNVFERNSEYPLNIRVFTSKRCEFSNVALEHVRSVVQSQEFRRANITIVEESIDDNVSLLEEYNIMALPMTVIGDYYLLGIPSTSDLKTVLNKVL